MDLIERLRARAKQYGGDKLLEEAAAALEAALEDAERYRWLRALDGACDAAACVNFNMGFDWYEHHGAELDAAIDQARGKGVAGG